MYDFIKGKLAESGPTHIVAETGGMGFYIHTSLSTAAWAKEQESLKLFIHLLVKEDDMRLYGFSDKSEREIFRLLISVSGIGANTAMVMLSSLSPAEIKQAVESENADLIQTIKGIGKKTAQRVIIELKDKMKKTETDGSSVIPGTASATIEEAVSALLMLGFPKKRAEAALNKIYKAKPTVSSEDAVKNALKML
jgi:holliday junction DNA helicase RuvA